MEIFGLCKINGAAICVKMIRSHWYKQSIIILLAGDVLSACTKDFGEQGLGDISFPVFNHVATFRCFIGIRSSQS